MSTVYLLNRYLFRACSVSDTVLGTEDTTSNLSSSSHRAYILVREADRKHIYIAFHRL